MVNRSLLPVCKYFFLIDLGEVNRLINVFRGVVHGVEALLCNDFSGVGRAFVSTFRNALL